MNVILLAPYDFSSMKGNTIRPALQCLSLVKNGFSAFELRSRVPISSVGYQQSKVRHGFWSWIPSIFRPLGVSNYLFDMPFGKKIEVDSSQTIVHAHNFYTFFLIPKNCIRIADLHTFKYNEMYFNYSDSEKHPNLFKRWIYKRLFAPIVRVLEKRICCQADKVIVASTNVGEVLADAFQISPDKFVCINNMVEVDKFTVNQHNEPFRIGVVGSFKDQLNKEVIPEVLKIAALTPLSIVLIGSILEEDAKVFETFPNVRVLGRVSDEVYKNWMSKMSVLLAPYTIHRQGGGSRNKLIEAAVSATPIVTTLGGAEGFGGMNLLRVGDSTASLVEQIEALQNADIRRALGQKLREYAIENFDCETEGKKLIAVYESLCK
ncbi:MAG: glycosyltransferase family 4 protein [Chitinophagales bacterium]